MAQQTITMVEKLTNVINSESYYYAGVRGSPFAKDCVVFGLNANEVVALSKRFPNPVDDAMNGVQMKGSPFYVINSLAELGYRVVASTGEAEILWTLQREV